MKYYFFLYLLLFLSPWSVQAQVYNDYIGGGHSSGIIVTTSDEYFDPTWNRTASGTNTINDVGLEAKLMEASRFLSQATFGADWATIQQTAGMDFEDWLDQQIQLTPTLLTPHLTSVYQSAYQMHLDNGGIPEDYSDRPEDVHFDYAWWQLNMTNDDVFRQRIAFALSEIFVISVHSDLDGFGEALSDYYDILIRNAFGNYENLLLEISLHPAMGVYLSHLNNPKADPTRNIHPDENYAREIMQLFSIGLFELHPDGSRKMDGNGKHIPTYDNDDIKEFAKVFTGLGPGGLITKTDVQEPAFGQYLGIIDFTKPMAMYEDFHETEAKNLLNGYVIEADQNGMEDVQEAVNHLFNHPNVGPFFSRQLIQRLVKSNPSPGYIQRVSSIFDNNGHGERGDLKAVVKAILLDDEARTCQWSQDEHQGKLKEPITRYTQFAKSIGGQNQEGLFWNIGFPFEEQTGQHPLHSSSVFNFYLPDFQPNGPIADEGLFAPEFQIHNTRTSTGYINSVNEWAIEENLFSTWEDNGVFTETDYNYLYEFAKDPEILINKLDVLLTRGQLSEATRQIIKTAISPFSTSVSGNFNRLKLATYLFMISPDYNVLK